MIRECAIHAESILREVGEITRREFGHSPIIREKQFHDIVTHADLAVQEFIRCKIKELYPSHGFNSEEDENPSRDANFIWVLDPIDGTKYYSLGIPIYSISLALEEQGIGILGAVYSPETNQMFVGTREQGAYLNGSRIQCTHGTKCKDATICVEIPSSDSSIAERKWAMDKLATLVDQVRRIRILGVSALDLCYCAMGGFDAYVNLGGATKHCDIAAGRVVVEAAGGQFLQKGQRFVAGQAALAEQLLDLLAR